MQSTMQTSYEPSLAPWPIASIPAFEYALHPSDRETIEQHASKLASNEPTLSVQSVFGEGVRCGWLPGPTLYLEDHREIELVSEELAQHFEYRSLSLAADGDFMLLSRPRAPLFESYLEQSLDLGSPTILCVPSGPRGRKWSLAKACLEHSPAMDRLVNAAKAAGGINIMPFISSGNVWLLAGAIAQSAGVVVNVSAAPPRLSQRANDKLWFAQQVKRIFGHKAIPPTYHAYGLTGAVARLHYLAQHTGHVVIKTPASAGARGNIMYDSAVLRKLKPLALKNYILKGLHAIGWEENYPVLVGVWEDMVQSSPSAQLWIPLPEDGAPVLEGIFVQKLQGDAGTFVGAVPATLPANIAERFSYEALMLASLLQQLGYFGRVSFDALLVGETLNHSELHWIECNARWGGVSIPMTVVNRLSIGKASHLAYVIVQSSPDQPMETSFANIQKKLKDLLFDKQEQSPGIVWLAPVGKGEGVVIFLALGKQHTEAERVAHEAREILANIL